MDPEDITELIDLHHRMLRPRRKTLQALEEEGLSSSEAEQAYARYRESQQLKLRKEHQGLREGRNRKSALIIFVGCLGALPIFFSPWLGFFSFPLSLVMMMKLARVPGQNRKRRRDDGAIFF